MFLFFHYYLIVPNKYGFRPGRNTSDCFIDLTEEIRNYYWSWRVCYYSAVILSKLAYNGINNLEYIWFKSSLQCRRQRVNGIFSDMEIINMCVLQGSILGPLLFLIYINDYIHSTNYFSVILFADDTSLSACGKDIDELLIS